MKASIKSIKIEVGKKTIELDVKDARNLFYSLKELFEKDVITIPQPYPAQPQPYNPWQPYWEWHNPIYCIDSSGTAKYDDQTKTVNLSI